MPENNKMWYKLAKFESANDDYIQSNVYGYWLLADGSLLPVYADFGHLGALKQFGMGSNTEAFRKNMIRLVTDNNELWVQFEWVKPNLSQKNKLIEMAKNYSFIRFIVDSDYLPEDRYDFSSGMQFSKLIRDIK